MKKIFLFLIILNCGIAQAQFEIVPGGFINKENPSQNYVVFNFDDQKASDLYAKVISSITSKYISPDDVTSNIPNEMINLRGVYKDICQVKVLGKKFTYTLECNLIFRFKDNRIRVDTPSENKLYTYSGYMDKCYLFLDKGKNSTDLYLFKTNGDIRYKEAKDEIEIFINGLINSLIYDTDNSNNNDDW